MGIRFVHTADLHLGSPLTWLGELAASRREDFLRTFDRIVNLVLQTEADGLLFAGDLFDRHNPESSLVERVKAGFARLLDARKFVIVLPGSHDAYFYPDSIYRTVDFGEVHILSRTAEQPPVELKIRSESMFVYSDVAVDFEPDCEETFKGFRKTGEPGYHIGVLHSSLTGTGECQDKPDFRPVTVDELVQCELDYIALGHNHTRFILHKGPSIVASPGSPEGRTFIESGERYVALVTLDGNSRNVEKIPVNTRTLLEIPVALDKLEDLSEKALCLELGRHLNEELLVRFNVTGMRTRPLDFKKIKEELMERAFYIEFCLNYDSFSESILEEIARETTLRGLFVKNLRKKADEPGANRTLLNEAIKVGLGYFLGGE